MFEGDVVCSSFLLCMVVFDLGALSTGVSSFVSELGMQLIWLLKSICIFTCRAPALVVAQDALGVKLRALPAAGLPVLLAEIGLRC